MYSDVVGRTQIYLGDEETALLDRVAQASGASRSELIRRAVRSAYGPGSAQDRLAALRESAGAWKGRRPSGRAYVDAVRGDLGNRLRQVGMPPD
jgi:Arc/MetJ-type ribon-helix-helix transcriptional regulator